MTSPKTKPLLWLTIVLAVLALAALFALRAATHEYGRDGHAHEEPETAHAPHGEGAGQGEGHEHAEEQSELAVPDSALIASGVTFGRLESRRLALRLPVLGRIVLNEERTAHLHPRYPGVIIEVRKQLGATVRKGEVLARIESNESLEPYDVIARKDGTVIGRHASLGESVTPERELFTVADLSSVWVDFQVYRQDFARLRAGQRVRVVAEGVSPAETPLIYLSPSVEGASQSLVARAELPNPKGAWTPGLFVQGEVALEDFTALAVPREAVQDIGGESVVFVREGEGRYRPAPVKLGRRDGDWLEVLEGPPAGTVIVVSNSYLLKAEHGKGEAGHDH